MNVGDLFLNLSYGDLSNLSMGMEGEGFISAEDQPKIIGYANNVLTQLYTRFVHKVNYVKLESLATVNTYHLRTVHAVTNTDTDNTRTRYIKDSVDEPFLGDLVKVISVFLEPLEVEAVGKLLTINNEPDDLAVKIIDFDSIYLKAPEDERSYIIEYQSKHARLIAGNDAGEQEIYLAPVLWEALESGICSRVFNSLGGEENILRARELMTRYENICQQVEMKDMLQLTSGNNHTKLVERGFK